PPCPPVFPYTTLFRSLRTTGELAQLVAGTVRTREKGQHPATRTFQAIRIHINEELAQLARALPTALTRLRAGGRMAVISFHSLRSEEHTSELQSRENL